MRTQTETTIDGNNSHLDTAVSYRLNTHQNGRRRPFPSSSEQFWREHAGVIGGLLRQEESTTADALFLACQDHITEFPTEGPYPEIDPGYVRWVLNQLTQLGMVIAEQYPSQIQAQTCAEQCRSKYRGHEK
mgnify:CR=1 FL=1